MPYNSNEKSDENKTLIILIKDLTNKNICGIISYADR